MQFDADVVRDAYLWCTDYLQEMLVIEKAEEVQLTKTCTASIVSISCMFSSTNSRFFFSLFLAFRFGCIYLIITYIREVKTSSMILVALLSLVGGLVVWQDHKMSQYPLLFPLTMVAFTFYQSTSKN